MNDQEKYEYWLAYAKEDLQPKLPLKTIPTNTK
jgi:hypothetical protein